ncbi:MAG: NAD(+)/NADH kinase [Candidatus Verstraetearchaeota archaeon]|nr:NAD(+)/NADH kinase [Candidatus Verstraetearchaeota archaeon]
MEASSVGLMAKLSEEAIALARRALFLLRSKRVKVYVEENTARLMGVEGVPLSKMRVNILMTIGGDGTILRAAQQVTPPETPLLGINLGGLGFLSEASPEQLSEVIEQLICGSFTVEYRSKLAVFHQGKRLPDALNELLVITARPSKVIEVEVRKDGYPFYKGKMDGVIVSTTTGSTAYALSAGGVIVDPEVDIIELVFVCPISPCVRPIILPPTTVLEVKVGEGGAPAMASIDGQFLEELSEGSTIMVRRSEHKAAFVKLRPDFYSKLKSKMHIQL